MKYFSAIVTVCAVATIAATRLPAQESNLAEALAAAVEHLQKGRYDEAEVALRAYMQRAPWDPAGPWRLGLLRLVQSRPVEALPLFRVALDLSAGSPAFRGQVDTVLREQASHLERSGRHAEATALLEERARLAERTSRRRPSP